MTTETVAIAEWRALDRDGRDQCRLVRSDGGWMLVGHARFGEAEGRSRLDYVIRCDAEWHTQGADVSGVYREKPVALCIKRSDNDWVLNDLPQPDVEGAVDIDLGFTPATNLMPLRRLCEVGRMQARAAWLRDPESGLQPLNQAYTRERGGLVRYEAEQTGFQTELKVSSDGFVTLYPGYWEAQTSP